MLVREKEDPFDLKIEGVVFLSTSLFYSISQSFSAIDLKLSKRTLMLSSFGVMMCPVCGMNTKHPLSKRDYDCAHCGYHHPDRDVKAAQMVLSEALETASNYNVSPERRTKSSVESGLPEHIDAGPFAERTMFKASTVKQEAQVL